MNVLDRAKALILKRRIDTGVPTSSEAALSLDNLAQLSLQEKERYIHALVPIALANGSISEPALARLYQLFAVTELSQDSRLEVLREVFFRKHPLGDRGSTFDTPEIQLSLAKDVIALSETSSSSPTDAAQKLLQRLNLMPGQIDFLHTWIDWENRIMDKIGRGDLQVRNEDLPTDLLAKAAAVGVPLTALYFSGSVVGFGAAGITSGLATIGSASLLAGLGLNPMTAGIAALIVGGIAIKKLLDAVLPHTREDAKKLEHSLELMKTIRRRYRDYLYEDIRAFAVGPWWERFSGRGSTRREAVGRLQQLADGDKIAMK
jgi:hypothetical protein